MSEPVACEPSEANLVEPGRHEFLLSGDELSSPLAEIIAPRAEVRFPSSVARIHRKSWPGRRTIAARPTRRRLRRSPQLGGPLIGILEGFNDSGQPLIRAPLDPSGRIHLARTTVRLTPEQVGREAVIAFEGGDLNLPIILGILLQQAEGTKGASSVPPECTVNQPIVHATLDGERLVLTAQSEIVLRCGDASLTLTRAGKVLLRGNYILSHSSSVNRIRGGSVQIN